MNKKKQPKKQNILLKEVSEVAATFHVIEFAA